MSETVLAFLTTLQTKVVVAQELLKHVLALQVLQTLTRGPSARRGLPLVCEVRWDVVAPSVRLYSCSTKVEAALALNADVASRRSIAGCVWGVYNPVDTPSKVHAHRRHVEEMLNIETSFKSLSSVFLVRFF